MHGEFPDFVANDPTWCDNLEVHSDASRLNRFWLIERWDAIFSFFWEIFRWMASST